MVVEASSLLVFPVLLAHTELETPLKRQLVKQSLAARAQQERIHNQELSLAHSVL